ncbi:MAG: hypothetical protein DWQ07_19415 [Chloroflexi bacterium]|nr:MAG: hypothetical protein DWQ07_19415 [Chloroflexota bacterium]MBL1194251.1 hypothetical protein [Chloroflexota bacterium]NOH11544.1 hypothetical protein [Chloroflexota bacterium]
MDISWYPEPVWGRAVHDWLRPDIIEQGVLTRTETQEHLDRGHNPWTPQSVPLWVSYRSKDEVVLNDGWYEHLGQINPDGGKAIYSLPFGVFNRGNPRGMDSLGWGGNIFQVLGELSDMFVVKAFNQIAMPKPPEGKNYFNLPWLYHQTTAIGPGGAVTYLPSAKDNYSFLMTDEKDNDKPREWLLVWKGRVERFPSLDNPVTVRPDISALWIRNTPDPRSPVIDKLQPGTTVPLIAYIPQGPNVWGQIDQNKFVALCWYNSAGFAAPRYYTDWYMETPPPPPPLAGLSNTAPEIEVPLPEFEFDLDKNRGGVRLDKSAKNPYWSWISQASRQRQQQVLNSGPIFDGISRPGANEVGSSFVFKGQAKLFGEQLTENGFERSDEAVGHINNGDEFEFVDWSAADQAFIPDGFNRPVPASEAWKVRVKRAGEVGWVENNGIVATESRYRTS